MGEQIILYGDPDVEVLVRRSAGARRLSLRISQLDGRVMMTLPNRTPLREAKVFAEEKADWIRRHLEQRPRESRPEIGGKILFEGRATEIIVGAGRAATFVEGQITVPDNPPRVAPRVAAFLKVTARGKLTRASDYFADQLGLSYERISIRDTRSRWGSCSSDKNLMYSWRLVMAPPAVLEYVAAHEVSHLAEMNHSPAYWRVVESIYPKYKTPRAWLRKNGQELHRFRFKD